MPWVISNQFYYSPCLTCWSLYGWLVPTMCKYTSCAKIYELPWGHSRIDKSGSSHCFLFWLHIFYAHLISIRFEQSVCQGSNIANFIMHLAWLVDHSKVDWYQQCVSIHHVPIDKSRRAHCFLFWLHIFYAHLISIGFEHSVCHESKIANFIRHLAWLVEHYLVDWYQQCLNVHHVPMYPNVWVTMGQLTDW